MSATALYWVQLQHAIRVRIAELAGVFREGITANAAVADPASCSEPPELSTVFRLSQEEAAENWLSAMGAACIVQLLAEAQSVWEHPNWRFLYVISKEEIAPRLEELLHASFGITQKDLGLIKRWDNGAIDGGAGFGLEPSTDSIARAFHIARAKKSAVIQILDQLLGVSRKLGFGEPSKPKFGVPAAQINTTTSPEVQPVPTPSVSSSAKPSEQPKDTPTSKTGESPAIESGRTDADDAPRRNAIARKIKRNPKGAVRNEEAAILFGVTVKTIRAWANDEVKSRRLRKGPKRGTITNKSILKLLNRRR